MKRELPDFEIQGTVFIVDVQKGELREKANPQNIMRIKDMYYTHNKGGYRFDYDPGKKNFLDDENAMELSFSSSPNEVTLPDLATIDPGAVAKKYGLTPEQVRGKGDFELTIKPGSDLDKRWNKGILPTVDIAGHTFYVDVRMDKLRPKDDFLSNGISFTEIEEYYDRDRRGYVIPYNPKTHEFQQDDVFAMRRLPKDTIIVQFPPLYKLDPVGLARKNVGDLPCIDESDYELHFTARTLPWEETNVIEHIKRNVAEQLQPLDEFRKDLPVEDHLFRVPTDTSRELPTHTIKGVEFVVDVNQLELRQKANPENVITMDDLLELDLCSYQVIYSDNTRKLFEGSWDKKIIIPEFARLDSEGMAKKHDMTLAKISKIGDFELMVDTEAYELRGHKDIIPTIDIAGHTFYVDLSKDRLTPKDDIWSRGIIFSELTYYYSNKDYAYIIPYNKSKHTFEEISLEAKEIPKDLIVVAIRPASELDPIWKNKELGRDKSYGLKKGGLKHHFEAKTIPWHHTRFAETVKRNNTQQIKTEGKPVKNLDIKVDNPATSKSRKSRKL